MDKSLDEIITTNKTSKRGGAAGGAKRTGGGRRGAGGGAGGAARAQVLGSRPGPTPAQRVKAAAASTTGALAQQPQGGNGGRTTRAAAAAGGVTTNTEKIIVSNLPLDVNEPNLKEFFVQMVGPVSSVNLSYDSKGKSKGVATIVFSRKGDANKAFKEFNNRLIDSSRPMRIELVVDPSKPLPLTSRVAPPVAASTGTAKTQGAPSGRPARGGKRRGGAAGGGGGERAKRTPKTAADLDAEMEDYSAAGATTTTTTVAPAAAAPAA